MRLPTGAALLSHSPFGRRGFERSGYAPIRARARALDDRYRGGGRAGKRARVWIDRKIQLRLYSADVNLEGALRERDLVDRSTVSDALVVHSVIAYRSGQDHGPDAARERRVCLVEMYLAAGWRPGGRC